MSRETPGDGRIIRLPIDEPWPPHDDTGDLEAATDRLCVTAIPAGPPRWPR